jgi:hypothetical protein
MWYEDGAASPACMWHVRQVELWSLPISKSVPPALALCMLWQPLHSATPPEWNACGVLPANMNIITTAKNPTPTPNDFLPIPNLRL